MTTIFPLIWSFVNSFKQEKLIRKHLFSIPIPGTDSFSLENYKRAFRDYSIGTAYRNSLIISCTVAIVVIVFAGMAAYIMARYKFFGKNILTGLLYSGMMFPIFATIIPVYSMMVKFGQFLDNQFYKQVLFRLWNFGKGHPMYDAGMYIYKHNWQNINSSIGFKLFCVILIQIAGNMSFAIIVLTSYIKNLPIELEEAAYMEGCNIFQIFSKVILPLCKPSFITVGIFSFLWSYNDLFTQMFFLRNGKQRTITYLLNCIASKEGIDFGLMFAAVSLIVIPVLVVYIALQKYIIEGMTVGAVKG
ncbi:MAG: carbohydrate ABC transporter permease [Lachnospiraceae bacterium]|nr:carbohydrate ABC transporter permease [Lachnospiraceae bacterium]